MSKIEKKDIEEEKEENKEEEEPETEKETEKETEEETESNGPEGEEIEKATREVVLDLKKALDIDGLKSKIDDFVETSNLKQKLFNKADVKKASPELSPEEKIVGFFQALVTGDKLTLKALSEGTPADLILSTSPHCA